MVVTEGKRGRKGPEAGRELVSGANWSGWKTFYGGRWGPAGNWEQVCKRRGGIEEMNDDDGEKE